MHRDLDQMIELTAHLYSAYDIAKAEVRRLEQRDYERLKKAQQRRSAPTTLPAHDTDRHSA